jgi:hypothetical protein
MMLLEKINDRRAWNTMTLGSRKSWYFELPDGVANAAQETLQLLREQPQTSTSVRPADYPLGTFHSELRPLTTALDNFPGFMIVRGFPTNCSSQELTTLYWLIGQMLGQPVEQNVQGTLLYDVRDTGQDVRYGARFSVTNAESSFHTDNSFGSCLVDYIGLLCINPSKSGGLNQLVSVYSAHNELLEKHPELLRVLYEPFHVDRRGGVLPGESPTVQFPIMAWDGESLTIRYLRYWIEAGHDKAGIPLTSRQLEALDALDQALNLSQLRAEFALEAGDILFVNNCWTLHNRTAFEDYDEPERKRHLVRLWVKSNGRGVN